MAYFLGKKQFFSLLTLLFFLLTLPFFVILGQKTQQHLLEAQELPANIFIDTQEVLGPLPKVWQVLSQGGEEEGRMLKPIISQLKELSPRYIRIDHIFNRYGLVSRGQNQSLNFDFSLLDKTVDDILATGAHPFFSLSYMPEVLSTDGSSTSPPRLWEEWSQVVEKLVEHYSGKDKRNLGNVYYEVWNEPDLFGKWQIAGEPNYLTLYHYASLGAQRAKNTNNFFIGGPATTSFYQNWIKGLLKYALENNLRVDFLSWHRYNTNPKTFLEDVEMLDFLLSSFPQFSSLQKIITEFGIDAENSSAYDTNLGAAHLITTIGTLLGKVDYVFIFEARDGLSPQGKEYWGRWGILTYFGKKKPRFYALSFLNKMGRHQVKVLGEGSFVKAIASKEINKIRVLLTNFDLNQNHSEVVPITFLNLEKGIYKLTQERLSGEVFVSSEVVTQDKLKKEVYLLPNETIFLDLEKLYL